MSSDAKDAKRPIIIIKRGGGHDDDHGGHWKIAYADFVTAMMAFFLVMWLVNAVSDKQRRGIARYFNATAIMDLRTGDGMLDGSRSALNGAESSMTPIPQHPEETPPADDNQVSHNAPVDSDNAGDLASSGHDQGEQQRFDAVRAQLDQMTQQGSLKDVSQNISVEMTPDGLRVQIFDRDGSSMFAPGSAEPNRRLTTILDALMPVLAGVRNGMVITGHTDSAPLDRHDYSNWELSADRANSTRRYLEAHGIAADRMVKVEGRAASDPLLPNAPGDPRNRRIALTLLRAGAAAGMRSAASETGRGN
jgi:chemotaxis protein MotB